MPLRAFQGDFAMFTYQNPHFAQIPVFALIPYYIYKA